MKKPSTQTMVVGSPIVAIPMTLLAIAGLAAACYGGSGLVALLSIGIVARVRMLSQQAAAYRAWKAEWDGMGDSPPPTSGKLRGVLKTVMATLLVVTVMATAHQLAHGAGYTLGWICMHPLVPVLGGLFLVALLRLRRRRRAIAKTGTCVRVVAKPRLSIPTIIDAYRGLPPYCHALLGRQA